MRISIDGRHPSARDLHELFRAAGWRTESVIPQFCLHVNECAGDAPEISCGDERLRDLLLSQLGDQGVIRVVVYQGIPGLDCYVGIPKHSNEVVQSSIERAIFRAFMFYARQRVQRPLPQHLLVPIAILLFLVIQAFG